MNRAGKFLKNRYFIGAVLLALAAVLFLADKPFSSPAQLRNIYSENPRPEILESSVVQINETKILVEIAASDAEIAKGLSGRPRLEPDKGMLFIFSRPDRYRFWMPDMRFPIDIIWINNKEIVGIDEKVSNDFDSVNPVFYISPRPAKYVLEVNSGFAAQKNFKVGDKVIFDGVK